MYLCVYDYNGFAITSTLCRGRRKNEFPEAGAETDVNMTAVRRANLFVNRDGRAGVKNENGNRRGGGTRGRVDGGDTGWNGQGVEENRERT